MAKVPNTIEQVLKELTKGKPSKKFVRRLADICWKDDNAEVSEIKLIGFPEVVLKASVSDQPAAIFCGHNQARSVDLLQQIGLLAYHFSIEWGVITNKVDTIIFNSHWLRDGGFVGRRDRKTI